VKIIRCLVQPHQVDRLMDAFASPGIVSVTVTGGSTWRRDQPGRQLVYRGRAYSLKFMPESVLEVTAADQAVDDVVRTVVETCAFGPGAVSGRILVLPVEERFDIGAGRRVA
jgi:nitrogen regulatory protein PII